MGNKGSTVIQHHSSGRAPVIRVSNLAFEGKQCLYRRHDCPLSPRHGASSGHSLTAHVQAQSPSLDNTSQHANSYFSPTPPPAAHYSHPPPAYPQQPPFHPNALPPAHQPAMQYAPPAAPGPPPQVFLGFLHKGNTTVPMYGPPGAKFNWIGNVWVELPDGTKDWIGPWYNAFGYEMKNPRQRAEEDCCWTNFGLFHDDLYWRK